MKGRIRVAVGTLAVLFEGIVERAWEVGTGTGADILRFMTL